MHGDFLMQNTAINVLIKQDTSKRGCRGPGVVYKLLDLGNCLIYPRGTLIEGVLDASGRLDKSLARSGLAVPREPYNPFYAEIATVCCSLRPYLEARFSGSHIQLAHVCSLRKQKPLFLVSRNF